MVAVVGKPALSPAPTLAFSLECCSAVDELRRRKPWCCCSTITLAVSFSRSKYYPLSAPPPRLTRAILQEDQDQDCHLLSRQAEEVSSSSNSQLYVCNLPRNYGISELLEIFTPYGTVQSVEVSRDAETGNSRGCGYVTMSSIAEANAAIAALDASDVGGREMRVRFSAQMTRGSSGHNLRPVNLSTRRDFMFESPYKIYVGNLAWSVTPTDLRNLFSQFGTVVSARLLHDRKTGKTRVYGFLSFSSASEREAALSLDGIVKISMVGNYWSEMFWQRLPELAHCYLFPPYFKFSKTSHQSCEFRNQRGDGIEQAKASSHPNMGRAIKVTVSVQLR